MGTFDLKGSATSTGGEAYLSGASSCEIPFARNIILSLWVWHIFAHAHQIFAPCAKACML